MDSVVISVFALVYFGMIPGLALDRTGIALLGAIALVVTGKVSPDGAIDFVDVATVALLFGLMVVSAQFRLGGFYSHVTRRRAPAWSRDRLAPSRSSGSAGDDRHARAGLVFDLRLTPRGRELFAPGPAPRKRDRDNEG